MNRDPRVFLYQSRESAPVLGEVQALTPERYPELRTADQVIGREAWLETALVERPSLLLLDRVDPAAGRPMLLGRQVELGDRGILDLAFLESTGVLSVVETKLAHSPELRREVVAQILDYGTYLTTALQSFAHLEALFIPADPSASPPKERDLAAAVWRFAGHGEPSGDRYTHWVGPFKRTVEENLQRKRLRLLIVADRIDPRLRELLEFLVGGARPTFQIALIEVTPYRLPGPDGRMLLVPSLHWCCAPPIRPLEIPSGKVAWTKDTFLEQMRFNNAEDNVTIEMVEAILHWMQQRAQVLGPLARLEFSTTVPDRPGVNLYVHGFKYALPHLEGGRWQHGWISLDAAVWQEYGTALRAFFTRLKVLPPCADLADLRLTGRTQEGLMIKREYFGDPTVRAAFLAALAELQDAILGRGK